MMKPSMMKHMHTSKSTHEMFQSACYHKVMRLVILILMGSIFKLCDDDSKG